MKSVNLVLFICLLGISLATKKGSHNEDGATHFTSAASKYLKPTVPIVKTPVLAVKPVHFKLSHAHTLHKKPHFVKPLSHNTLSVPVFTPVHKIHQKYVPKSLHAPIHQQSASALRTSSEHHHGKRDTALSQKQSALSQKRLFLKNTALSQKQSAFGKRKQSGNNPETIWKQSGKRKMKATGKRKTEYKQNQSASALGNPTHNKKHHLGKRDTALSQNAGSSLINFQVQEVNDIDTQNTNNAATVNTGTPAFGGAFPSTGNFGRLPMGGVSPFSGSFGGNRFGSFPGRFPGQHFGGHGLVHGIGHGHGLGGNRFPGTHHGIGYGHGLGGNRFPGNQFGGFGGGFRPHGNFNRPMFF